MDITVKAISKFLKKKYFGNNFIINKVSSIDDIKKNSKMDYSGSLEQTSLKDWNKFIRNSIIINWNRSWKYIPRKSIIIF